MSLEHMGSYNPGAWGWAHGPAASIVPFSFDGHDFPGGIAHGTAPYFTAALDILCATPGFSLPSSRSLDAGMWGYEDRRVSGTNNWSFHAYGLALDIAAPWNPAGARTPSPGPHRLPVDTGARLSPFGFEWGGDWPGSPDWMHIELHLSPSDVAFRWGLGLPPAPTSPGAGGTPFPLPRGCYFGPYEGPAESISGSGRNDAQFRPALQRAQTALGVIADGYYGPNTAAATRAWQLPRGLECDGLIGPDTWRSLDI